MPDFLTPYMVAAGSALPVVLGLVFLACWRATGAPRSAAFIPPEPHAASDLADAVVRRLDATHWRQTVERLDPADGLLVRVCVAGGPGGWRLEVSEPDRLPRVALVQERQQMRADLVALVELVRAARDGRRRLAALQADRETASRAARHEATRQAEAEQRADVAVRQPATAARRGGAA